MYQQILQEQQALKAESDQLLTQKLRRNEELAKDLTNVLTTDLNQNVIQMHRNQQHIDALITKNKQETQRLIKNSKRWVEAYDQLLYGLKEIGDLSNWGQIIEEDTKNIAAVIEIRNEQKQQQLKQ
eukprot:403343147